MIKSFKDQPSEAITPQKTTEDIISEPSLRPQKLSEFIGQKEVLDNLSVYIQAVLEIF